MHDLEQQLRTLAGDIDWPDEAGIAGAVRGRLGGPARRTLGGWKAAAVAVVVVGVSLSIAPVRDKMADALSLLGITIRQVEETTADPGRTLELGEHISLADAGGRTDAEFFVANLGRPPDGVYLDDSVPGGMLSLVWEPDDRFPAVGETGVGLLTSHFLGDGVAIVKSVGPDTEVQSVMVNGIPGWWISGAPHDYVVEEAPGVPAIETLRLAANVLVWTDGGTTHRIETAADLETVLSVLSE